MTDAPDTQPERVLPADELNAAARHAAALCSLLDTAGHAARTDEEREQLATIATIAAHLARRLARHKDPSP
jgi:hypothetical protein